MYIANTFLSVIVKMHVLYTCKCSVINILEKNKYKYYYY